jgi:hypothetical protein
MTTATTETSTDIGTRRCMWPPASAWAIPLATLSTTCNATETLRFVHKVGRLKVLQVHSSENIQTDQSGSPAPRRRAAAGQDALTL